MQRIADALESALEWPLSREEVRRWLRKRSESQGTKLILLLDNVSTADPKARQEIEDLSSRHFGPGLQLVVALNDNAADKLKAADNWLTRSPIGRIAVGVDVEPLTDLEFQVVQEVFSSRGMAFAHGAEHSSELREPWVLRALAASALPTVPDEDLHAQGHRSHLPPMLGLELMRYARSRFTSSELSRLYQSMAKALIRDANDKKRSPALLLSSIDTFMVRRETLEEIMQPHDVGRVIERGFLRAFRHHSGVEMLYVRLPELVASELSIQVAEELVRQDSEEPRSYLKTIELFASMLPMGDLIVAQAIIDASQKQPKLIGQVIKEILEHPVETFYFTNAELALMFPNGECGTLTLNEEGVVQVTLGGKIYLLNDVAPSDVGCSYTNLHAWIVLAHVAMGLIHTSDGIHPNVPSLLIELCRVPVLLRKPKQDYVNHGVNVVETSTGERIVAPDQGFLDSATYSLYRVLISDRDLADSWINHAVALNSVHLVGRAYTALIAAMHSADTDVAKWARETLISRIYPEWKRLGVLEMGVEKEE
ncbi:hypothetical protein DBR45_23630 [Pseudomonas sp. HMWF031]|nr:hypothetical protein DBR45_23630 [Pseudomonas sp. HMWF031]